MNNTLLILLLSPPLHLSPVIILNLLAFLWGFGGGNLEGVKAVFYTV